MTPEAGAAGSPAASNGAADAAVVAVLLAISFFSAISGKPLDGTLMLIVAAGLAWDAVRHRARPPASHVPADRRPADGWPPSGVPSGGVPSGGVPAPGVPSGGWPSDGRAAGGVPARGVPRGGGRGAPAAALMAAALYAGVVGSFARYSWPATAAVVGLGAAVVLTGWHGPLARQRPPRQRPVPGRLPSPGTALWGGVLVLGGLWELFALLRQPSLGATSYAHPTISALTDPILASAGGRSLVLAGWLAIGAYLARR